LSTLGDIFNNVSLNRDQGRDRINPRALENHPKAIPWKYKKSNLAIDGPSILV
jgi:hypothetical protein